MFNHICYKFHFIYADAIRRHIDGEGLKVKDTDAVPKSLRLSPLSTVTAL